MHNLWVKAGEGSGVEEAAKRPFPNDIGKAVSAGWAEGYKVELVSSWVLFCMHLLFPLLVLFKNFDKLCINIKFVI
jgi:hypothetical protein